MTTGGQRQGADALEWSWPQSRGQPRPIIHPVIRLGAAP